MASRVWHGIVDCWIQRAACYGTGFDLTFPWPKMNQKVDYFFASLWRMETVRQKRSGFSLFWGAHDEENSKDVPLTRLKIERISLLCSQASSRRRGCGYYPVGCLHSTRWVLEPCKLDSLQTKKDKSIRAIVINNFRNTRSRLLSSIRSLFHFEKMHSGKDDLDSLVCKLGYCVDILHRLEKSFGRNVTKLSWHSEPVSILFGKWTASRARWQYLRTALVLLTKGFRLADESNQLR